MLTIFEHAFSAVDTVYTLRMLNRRMFKLASDPYIQTIFAKVPEHGVTVEVRLAPDIQFLKKAIKYSRIVSCQDLLVADIYFEFPPNKTKYEAEILELCAVLRESRAYKRVMIAATKSFRFDDWALNQLLTSLKGIKIEQLLVNFEGYGPIPISAFSVCDSGVSELTNFLHENSCVSQVYLLKGYLVKDHVL
jgi:hypothetical protein